MRIAAILANADNATTRTGEALEVALFKIRYPWVWKQIWKQLVNEFKPTIASQLSETLCSGWA